MGISKSNLLKFAKKWLEGKFIRFRDIAQGAKARKIAADTGGPMIDENPGRRGGGSQGFRDGEIRRNRRVIHADNRISPSLGPVFALAQRGNSVDQN
jgi:hypothetical protein